MINHSNCDTVVSFSNALLLTQYRVERVPGVNDGADHDPGSKEDEAQNRANELLFGYIDRFLK